MLKAHSVRRPLQLLERKRRARSTLVPNRPSFEHHRRYPLPRGDDLEQFKGTNFFSFGENRTSTRLIFPIPWSSRGIAFAVGIVGYSHGLGEVVASSTSSISHSARSQLCYWQTFENYLVYGCSSDDNLFTFLVGVDGWRSILPTMIPAELVDGPLSEETVLANIGTNQLPHGSGSLLHSKRFVLR